MNCLWNWQISQPSFRPKHNRFMSSKSVVYKPRSFLYSHTLVLTSFTSPRRTRQNTPKRVFCPVRATVLSLMNYLARVVSLMAYVTKRKAVPEITRIRTD